jgi:hypothetical protein
MLPPPPDCVRTYLQGNCSSPVPHNMRLGLSPGAPPLQRKQCLLIVPPYFLVMAVEQSQLLLADLVLHVSGDVLANPARPNASSPLALAEGHPAVRVRAVPAIIDVRQYVLKLVNVAFERPARLAHLPLRALTATSSTVYCNGARHSETMFARSSTLWSISTPSTSIMYQTGVSNLIAISLAIPSFPRAPAVWRSLQDMA